MTIKTIGAIFNLQPDGSIVLDGDHSPGVSDASWGQLGISASRTAAGQYIIAGPGIAWPPGNKLSIYQDDNGDNTSWVKTGTSDAGLTIDAYTPADHTVLSDITYLLTVSVRVTLDIADPVQPVSDSPDSVTASAGAS